MCSFSTFRAFAVFSFITLFPLSQALSQPTVALSASPQNNFHSIIFTFTQNDLQSMEGCHYNLFAADEASDLATLPGEGLSIATFYKPLNTIQIIADPLPHLSRLYGQRNPKIRRTVKVYFRTLLSCPGVGMSGLGDVISLPVKTFPSGRLVSMNRLIKKMKYNMRYYEPVPFLRR